MLNIKKTIFACIALALLVTACGTQKTKESTSKNTNQRSAQDKEAFAQLLGELTQDSEFIVQMNAVGNPHTPSDALAKAARNGDETVLRYFTVGNPNMPKELLDSILLYDEPWVAGSALRNKNYTSDFLEHLFRGDQALCSKYGSDYCDDDFRDKLKNDFMISDFARNPNTPGWILTQIYNPTDSTTNYNIAIHSNAAADLLTTMSKNEVADTREWVARNPKTPLNVLKQLFNDRNKEVRNAAYKNPSLPQEVIAELASNPNVEVRYAILYNPSIAPSTIEMLANDPESLVRNMAMCDPKLSQKRIAQLAESTDQGTRMAIAQNPNTPASLIEELAQDSDPEVRKCIAINPKATPELLAQLAEDTANIVRRNVVRNENTPVLVLAQLAKDKNIEVRKALVANYAIGGATIIQLLKEIYSKQLTDNPDSEDEIEDDTYEVMDIASNPKMPLEVLQYLAKSNNLWIRSSVAENRFEVEDKK